ncbi:TM2 domain-containing protein almondex-like [Pollicipes pollicipes]|uniref:TM2 domain-containing protein almondex-like n=1 Tax=Pollicipes pollicipes TaxID=41117 RepID=UPI0018853E7E|nr:TM2 domain-containing protein almondex-like [Pollicipes pollicipes]
MMGRTFVLLALLVLASPSIKSELQSVNEDQACLHGSSDSSQNCGSPGVMESNGSAQHDSPSPSSSSQSKEEAGDDWSQPVPDGQCGRAARAAGPCRRLPAGCLSCQFNRSCVYGANVTVLCRPAADASCTGSTLFNKTMVCSYCYQTPTWQHDCSLCNVMARGRKYYRANCTVADDVLCMGRRTFHKSLFCKWTKGDRWGTALALSILLGGFGVDRFYLGHWQEAIGKFFSFGGLGVWTLIDVVLIAIGYLSPADGSLYIT